MRSILISAIIVFLPLIIAASAPVAPQSGGVTVTFECDMYFMSGKQPQVLNCEIVGFAPHPISGEDDE